MEYSQIAVLVILAASSAPVLGGNYMECPMNPCQQGGQCILMSPSPSPFPLDSLTAGDSPVELSSAPLSWWEARTFCYSHGAKLAASDTFDTIVLDERDEQDLARALFQFERDQGVIGVWTEQTVNDHIVENQCAYISLSDLSLGQDLVSCNDSDKFLALCVRDTRTRNRNESISYLYSCQCPKGYGYENCTKVPEDGNNEDGNTFCFNDYKSSFHSFEISNEADGMVMIIDHLVYGRPFKLPESGKFWCKDEYYAKTEEDFCVASNSLAAMIYWCQGKTKCNVTYEFFTDTEDHKELFLGFRNGSLNYDEAKEECRSQKGRIGLPVTEDHFRQIQRQLNESENINAEIAWMFIDPKVEHFTDVQIIWEDDSEQDTHLDCLAMSNQFSNKYARDSERFMVHFRRIMCNETINGGICEASFGRQNRDSVDDLSCLKDVSPKLIEFRYHGDIIDGKAISCPMEVDQRFSNTCYKKTEEKLSWREARRQCWLWGGDLAFPLRQDSPDCAKPTYMQESEEVWLANDFGCDDFDTRCVVPFSSSTYFMEGTYGDSISLCEPQPNIDIDCVKGQCEKLRKGLCALAPVITPRTHFPPPDVENERCPPVPANSPNWPFGSWAWEEPGIPGEISEQECPPGQKGTATWTCGIDGDWIGYPDMSECRKIDIDKPLEELDKEDSVPSEVVGNFYNEVNNEQDIASGDIAGVLQVLQKAIDVQNERLPNATDPDSYADKFTASSIDLLDEVLRRPVPWLGIGSTEKRETLTSIQTNVDEIADSILTYSTKETRSYDSPSKALRLKLIKSPKLTSGEVFSDGDSSIKVQTSEPSAQSISFQSFSSISCILAEQSDCESELTEPTQDVVNSVVLGATLFDATQRVIKTVENVNVVLNFKFKYEGSSYNLSSDISCGYWENKTNFWSPSGCQVTQRDNDSSTCECNHLTNFGVILDINGSLEGKELLNLTLTWITIVGCTISIISLIICVYIFTFVRGLRGERTTIHRNLCICLLLAEILLLSGLDATFDPILCGVIAGFLHFLFLAVFAWMFVEGMHVYQMLVKVFDSAQWPMWSYYAIGYGSPTVIVVLSVIIVESTGIGGYGTERYCWLDWENGLIWAFACPVVLVIVFNTFMFAKALIIARRTGKKKTQPSFTSNDDKKHNLILLKGSFSLVCILGITWVFGFTYFAKGSEWLAIIFALMNSLQGFFILLFHVIFNDKSRQEVIKFHRRTFKMTKAFVTRQPYEPSASTSDNPRSQVNYSQGNSNAVTLTTDVNSVSAENETHVDKEDPREHEPDEPVCQDDHVQKQPRLFVASYFRSQGTMNVVHSKSPINLREHRVVSDETKLEMHEETRSTSSYSDDQLYTECTSDAIYETIDCENNEPSRDEENFYEAIEDSMIPSKPDLIPDVSLDKASSFSSSSSAESESESSSSTSDELDSDFNDNINETEC